MSKFEIGDLVTSTFGDKHKGEVVDAVEFEDGSSIYYVKRESDEFVWLGTDSNVVSQQDSDRRFMPDVVFEEVLVVGPGLDLDLLTHNREDDPEIVARILAEEYTDYIYMPATVVVNMTVEVK